MPTAAARGQPWGWTRPLRQARSLHSPEQPMSLLASAPGERFPAARPSSSHCAPLRRGLVRLSGSPPWAQGCCWVLPVLSLLQAQPGLVPQPRIYGLSCESGCRSEWTIPLVNSFVGKKKNKKKIWKDKYRKLYFFVVLISCVYTDFIRGFGSTLLNRPINNHTLSFPMASVICGTEEFKVTCYSTAASRVKRAAVR